MKQKTDVIGDDESRKSPEVVLDLTAQASKVDDIYLGSRVEDMLDREKNQRVY